MALGTEELFEVVEEEMLGVAAESSQLAAAGPPGAVGISFQNRNAKPKRLADAGSGAGSLPLSLPLLLTLLLLETSSATVVGEVLALLDAAAAAMAAAIRSLAQVLEGTTLVAAKPYAM